MSLSWIYEKIVCARNALYDRGVFETFDLGARTISIGNITAGGTGKTPLVFHTAEILARRGERVCILTRGYGRKDPNKRVLVSDGEKIFARAREAGDEPFELAQKLLGKAIVVADADRVAAAEWAKRRFDVTAFVLDDGFQHRKVKRDVDIVCIDATDPFGGGRMLPAGRLREPLHSLKRANVIVITRADLGGDVSNLRSEILEVNSTAVVFEATTEIANLCELQEFLAKTQRTQSEENVFHNNVEMQKDKRALAFCGIGNPENFFAQLRLKGFAVTASKAFRDHHVYTQADADKIEREARECGAQMLLTTAKDAVKLTGLKFDIPCFVVEIDIAMNDDAGFASML